MAMQRFTRRVAEAAAGTGEAREALKFLGIQLKDSGGKIRPAEVLLGEVADSMTAIEDPALRLRIAFKLFDSEGVAMVNMLDEGAAGIKRAGDEVERYGVMTEQQARASERFVDNLTRLKQSFKGLGYEIGFKLLPTYNRWMVSFREWIVANKKGFAKGFTKALRDIRELFQDVAWVIRGVIGWLKKQREAIAAQFPILGELFGWIDQWVDKIGWAKVAIAGITAALSLGLITAILGLFVPLAQLTFAIGVLLVNAFALLTGAMLAHPLLRAITLLIASAWLLYDNWDEVTATLAALWAILAGKISGLWDTVMMKLVDFADGVRDIFGALFDWLDRGWSSVITSIVDAVDKITGGGYDPNADGGVASTAAGRSAIPTGASSSSIFGRGGEQTRVGGEVKVSFENAPSGMKIREIRAENPDVPLEVEAGYAMSTQ